MASAAVISAPDGPLGSAEQAAVTDAHRRAKKVRRAAGVAAFNGWITAVFAAISAPFAAFSLSGFVIFVGLALVAYHEFRGRRRLLEFDPTAARLLGWNQLGFLALILGYCVWMLFGAVTGEGPFSQEVAAKPELGAVIDNVEQLDQLYVLAMAAVYISVAGLSCVFQGLNAVYYFTRRRHVEAYLAETPDGVEVTDRLRVLLARLAPLYDHALALISGRAIRRTSRW